MLQQLPRDDLTLHCFCSNLPPVKDNEQSLLAQPTQDERQCNILSSSMHFRKPKWGKQVTILQRLCKEDDTCFCFCFLVWHKSDGQLSWESSKPAHHMWVIPHIRQVEEWSVYNSMLCHAWKTQQWMTSCALFWHVQCEEVYFRLFWLDPGKTSSRH